MKTTRLLPTSLLTPASIALLLVALASHGLPAQAGARGSYEMVIHSCGATETFIPIENLIVVSFAPGVSADANFHLAQEESFLVRSAPEETARDGAAIYALPAGESFEGAMQRVLGHDEVNAVMPALVPEGGAKVLFLHPGKFTANLSSTTTEEQQQLIERLGVELGLEAFPTELKIPQLRRTTNAAPQSVPNLIEVWVPKGGDLFEEMARVRRLDGILGVGVTDLRSILSAHNDSYRIGDGQRTAWYVLRTHDGGNYTEVRQDYLEADSLMVVEFHRPLPAVEVEALMQTYGFEDADPDNPLYSEVPAADRERFRFFKTASSSTELSARLLEEVPDLVRGALPGYRRPNYELEKVEYLRPREIRLEYLPDIGEVETRFTLQRHNLTEIRRSDDTSRELLVIEATIADDALLFPTLRGVRRDLNIVNAEPILVATDNEVQLADGHQYQRREPILTYVDEEEQTVRLHSNRRLLVLSFSAAASADERAQVAAQHGLRLMPVRQNLDLRDNHDVYAVPDGANSVELAGELSKLAVSSPIIAGAAPVLLDAETGRQMFGPESWLRVAVEPKSPQSTVDQLLERYDLFPAVARDLPAAQDPYLDPRGEFWAFYISRRLPVIAPHGADLGELLTALNREAVVVWAHPYSLSPALDRGSQLVMRNFGGGWYKRGNLDGDLNMLVHLFRTTSWEVVEGYAARAELKIEQGRVPVIVEPSPDSSAIDVEQALAAIEFELAVNDGQRLFGFVPVDGIENLADVPGVGMIRAKESHVPTQR